MAVQDYKINYKSDFVLTINGDAGWAIPFCIKFWTGMPSQAYFVGFDGVKYVNCRVGDTPTQLLVMFDDHHLPIGKLKMQIAYHTTIEEFPGSVFDEVTNARDVIVTIDGTDYQVMLDFTGEDAPELEFDLPAYANEAERIQNELQRQQNEADRIEAELQREQATAAAVQGAENVNAQLNGTTLTVTNRKGVSTSVNTKGEPGAQGPVGPEGQQGEQGPKGEKGDTGATGPQGIQGPAGPQGIQGPAGPQGQTGVSITDFVKTGETETDTLYDIEFSDDTTKPVAIPKGEKGDQGEQGPEGPQGPMGDVAVITPEQQAAFTMYSTTGQNTDGPMTQKAVTDKLVAGSISYDNSQSVLAATDVQGAVDEVDSNSKIEVETLYFNQSRTFGSAGTSYMSSPAASFEVGKKYKIIASLNKVSSDRVGIYAREVAANNNPNVFIGNIIAGQTSAEFIYTPNASKNYQYISAYAPGSHSSLTWTVKIYEISYNHLTEVKTELEEKIGDVDAKITTDDSDNVQLVMTNNYVRQNILMNASTLVWQTASAGYFSRLIQMEDGIYTLERITSKPILYAIVDSQYQHIGAVPTFIRGRTSTSAATIELEGKKGWWLYVRDDDSKTYDIPNIYFRRKDKFEVTNDAVDEVKYEKVLLDAGTVSTSHGVVANRDNANLGNLVSTTGSYKATDYIDISDYDKIQFTHLASGYQSTQQNTGAVFYDDTKTPITDYCFYRHMGVWGNAKYTIDRPSNAKYIRTTLASTDAISRVYGYKERSNSGGSTEESTPKIIRRNTDAIEAIYAAKKMTKQAVGGSYNYNDPNHMLNFCIAHISDIHTDTERYLNFRQFVDGVDGIDAAIHTGDVVINSQQNQYNNIKYISGEKPVMSCVGNHDRGVANTSSSIHTPSLATLKTWMGMDNLYYYKDFTKNEPVKNTLCYKIRVIVLNQYDFESDGTTHMSSLNATSIYSQTQLDWLVSTLQDALTNGYAVMIGMHTFDGNSWNSFKTNDKKFYDRIIARQDGAPFSGNKVIEDLINAFKNGGSINQTYTYADGSTATVNTSFASQGTFIAYMIGHGHRDIIAYSSNYPDQLYLGVNTGCLKGGYADRPYGTELSALARQAGDKSEDCFNVYGIDMKAKTVRVVRVGATLDDYFNKIDYDIYSF